jgi:hypothetical protein
VWHTPKAAAGTLAILMISFN